jgi:hypothetical protein
MNVTLNNLSFYDWTGIYGGAVDCTSAVTIETCQFERCVATVFCGSIMWFYYFNMFYF